MCSGIPDQETLDRGPRPLPWKVPPDDAHQGGSHRQLRQAPLLTCALRSGQSRALYLRYFSLATTNLWELTLYIYLRFLVEGRRK